MLDAYVYLENISFQKSKTQLHRNIFVEELQKDYYCGCDYDRSGKVDINSCGYKIRKNANRAFRIEWEHVVPASKYGRTLECWKHGGRKNCSRNSTEFIKFEQDLHNLRPVIGEVNGDRSNLDYGIADPFTKPYGQCEFKVDFQSNVAEPPDSIKGDMARITLYMIEKYSLQYDSSFLNLMYQWHQNDPVDDREKIINRKIKEMQGDSNYYVEFLN